MSQNDDDYMNKVRQDDYGYMRINYSKDGSYSISGNLNEEGQSEVLENFLRGQMWAKKDEIPANKSYIIEIRWYPEDDRIESYSNTGNIGLRNGILWKVFGELSELEERVSA